MTGFQIIGEMTKEELLEEIIAHQRMHLDGMNIDNLRRSVIQIRLEEYQARLFAEAGVSRPQGILGFLNSGDDDE